MMKLKLPHSNYQLTIPPWTRWLAMDKDGKWFVFSHRPSCSLDNKWTLGIPAASARSKLIAENDLGGWKSQLYKVDVPPPLPDSAIIEVDLEGDQPLFEEVPAWANWLAQDESGAWYAFEKEPSLDRVGIWRTKRTEDRSILLGRSELDYLPEDQLFPIEKDEPVAIAERYKP